MNALTQSAFLQALGYSIANSLWQCAFLWILASLLSFLYKYSSEKKYFASVFFQAIGFIWFVFTFQYYYVTCSETFASVTNEQAVNGASNYAEPVVSTLSSAIMYGMIKAEMLLPYFAAAYILLLGILVTRFMLNYYQVRVLQYRQLRKPPVHIKLFIQRTSELIGIKKEIRVYFSELVQSPLTIGFFKPLILLPFATLNSLTTEQMEAVLLHELAHIKRADYLINIIQTIIETILFFNPFIRLLGNVIRKERENSCDDRVLQFQYNAGLYAEALLRIASIKPLPAFALSASGKNGGELLSRVKRMLNHKEKNYTYSYQLIAFVFITFLLTSIAWLKPERKENIYTSSTGNVPDVMIKSFTAGVANPLFSPVYFFTKPSVNDNARNGVSSENTYNEKILSGKTDAVDLSEVTPIELQRIYEYREDAEEKIDDAVADIADQSNAVDMNRLTKVLLYTDTTDMDTYAVDMLQTEMKKIDKEKLSKATQDLQTTLKNLKSQNIFTDQKLQLINIAINKSLGNLQSSATLVQQIAANNAVIEQQKNNERRNKKEQIILEKISKKKQADHINSGLASTNLSLAQKESEADMLLRNYGIDLKTYIRDSLYSNNYTTTYSYALPAAYSSYAGSSENIDIPDAGIIIIKCSPSNKNSYRKIITVDIVPANGEKKTLVFVAEVYQ